MPGRASSRSTRSSGAAVNRKSSTTTLKSRGSASARTSAYAVEIPDEGELTSLRTRICQIFGDAQKTTATQRKLVVSLRKIQEACCYEPQTTKKKHVEEEFDEADFNEEVARCILRIMGVKKSEPVGDRIIRFLGVFLKHATERDNAILQPEDEEMNEYPETPSSRLTSHVLSTVLSLTEVKDKTVRFRATMTVAHIVNSLDQIDDELFNLIRLKLAKRLRDKEPSVRVQAVLGLGRLADNDDEENDDDDSDDDTAGGVLLKLLDIMQNDPSAEVRRMVLMNLPFRPTTLRWLLERARDSDPATRRALYGKLLPALGDFRHMSLVEREKLLRWGLRDRDETVRKATARLFRERWIEDCASKMDPTPEEEKKPGDVCSPNLDALLELLERIDVVRSGAEEGMAHQAMREFWDGRPDYRDSMKFDDDFWNDLTAESAFVARSLNDYHQSIGDDGFQDDKMPEVKRLAFFVRNYLNHLINTVIRSAEMEDDDPEYQEIAETADEMEFVVEQLLHIALTLDYTDEVGRQQMATLMKEALTRDALPEECTRLAIEVLRTVCGSGAAGEKEFCSLAFEAIAEVRSTLADDDTAEEGDNVDDSFHSAQSDPETVVASDRSKKPAKELDPQAEEERHLREAMVFLKCLHIAQCTLQNVHSGLEENNSLVTLLNTLIVPAVRSHDEMIRERGVVCLGLASLLSKDLANSNIDLFLHCYAIGPDSLKVHVIQVLTDIIITHPSLIAPVPAESEADGEEEQDAEPTPNPRLKQIMKVFLKAFTSEKASLTIEACVAGSKLLLLNVLPPASISTLLKTFTLTYFNPDTASNPALRQALSYFLPVFCHSRLKNAALMAQLAVPVIQKLLVMRDDVDEEADEMVGWPIVAGHLAEWTDGRRVVGAEELGIDGKSGAMDGIEEPHIQLAVDILERALRESCTRDEKKPLLSLLTKLHIASTPAKNEPALQDSLRDLHQVVSEAVESKLGLDATSRNYLSKLEIGLTKRLGEVEHVTQVQDQELDEGDETEIPISRPKKSQSQTPEIEAKTEDGEAGATETNDEEEEEEEEDTMLADMQAEGTRMPLEFEDDDDDTQEEASTVTVTVGRTRKSLAFTEDDIVDSLLESEML